MLSRLKKVKKEINLKFTIMFVMGKMFGQGGSKNMKKLLSIETINSVQQSHLKTQEENFCRQNIPNSDSLTFKGIIID